MPATVDVLGAPKNVLIVASNPAVSERTGWPIGFWWAELTHPYWEFVEAGYQVTIASPDGGELQGDGFSDPADESQYSAHDLISRGFMASPAHAALVADTPALADLDLDGFDAVFLVGGQAPMYTFRNDQRVVDLVGQPIQPFRIEDEARGLSGTNFIVQGAFRPHAVRDGNLITGQQQYSGTAAARLVIDALGR